MKRLLYLDKGAQQDPKLSSLIMAKLLIEHSCLKYLKCYPKNDSYFLYDDQIGIYRELENSEVQLILSKVLSFIGNEEYEHFNYVAKVLAQLKLGPNSYLGAPQFTKGVIVFENGVLELRSFQLSEHSPDIFSITRLPFSFDSKAKCPRFQQFIFEFCNGHLDRVKWIKAWLYALITNRLHNQVFIVIRGVAATGKSTMGHVATALVGKEATITTSLCSLNSDSFEILNLQGKETRLYC